MERTNTDRPKSLAALLISNALTADELEGENVFIGGIMALRKPEKMKDAGITHILSVLKVPPVQRTFTQEENLAEFDREYIEVDDLESENILVHFPRAYTYIMAGQEKGKVLVHCAAGRSRSASVLAAYLMKKYSLSVSEALDRIRKIRPVVEPNPGFREQLQLYQQMGYTDNIEDHPIYQRWMWEQEVQRSVAMGVPPQRVFFRDAELAAERIAGTQDESTPVLELRCKKCRRALANSSAFVPHEPKRNEVQQNGRSAPCAHHFLEPLRWMESELSQGNLSGKLECPKCKSKVGTYAWQGSKCSCGEWVVPGISVARGRVDEVKVRVAK